MPKHRNHDAAFKVRLEPEAVKRARAWCRNWRRYMVSSANGSQLSSFAFTDRLKRIGTRTSMDGMLIGIQSGL